MSSTVPCSSATPGLLEVMSEYGRILIRAPAQRTSRSIEASRTLLQTASISQVRHYCDSHRGKAQCLLVWPSSCDY